MHSLFIAPYVTGQLMFICCTERPIYTYMDDSVQAKPWSVPYMRLHHVILPAYHHLISYLQQELNAMLLEAALEDEAALLPPQ